MKEKTFKIIAYAFTLVILVSVAVLNSRFFEHTSIPDYVYTLPLVNSILNGTCFVLLLLSFWAVKKKNISLHKNINIVVTLLSVVFVVCYVLYHFWAEETSYGGSGALKGIYYFVLLTHIVLSAVVLPMVLMSLFYAFTKNISKHKKWVKWAYPIWLYVTFTGVLVYLMLSPYYPQ